MRHAWFVGVVLLAMTVATAATAEKSKMTQGKVTAVTADSITIQTGSWSLERPVLLDACNACAVCAVFCPEGAIAREGGVMAIDYAHCKGCGICEVVCPVRNALTMEEVAA